MDDEWQTLWERGGRLRTVQVVKNTPVTPATPAPTARAKAKAKVKSPQKKKKRVAATVKKRVGMTKVVKLKVWSDLILRKNVLWLLPVLESRGSYADFWSRYDKYKLRRGSGDVSDNGEAVCKERMRLLYREGVFQRNLLRMLLFLILLLVVTVP
jgi:hypothetical protein